MSNSIEKWNAPAQGREKVGFSMVKAGAATGGVVLAASALPFVGIWMLVGLLIIGGFLFAA